MAGRPPKCPFCGQSKSIAKGFRRTKYLGLRRLRRCLHCRRKFTPRHQQRLDTQPTASDLPTDDP